MRKLLTAAGLLALAACQSVPVEAQLATACNSLAAGYRSAAAYAAEGKLDADTVQALKDAEPVVEAACDPDHPPADTAAALTSALTALQTVTLANAGVH